MSVLSFNSLVICNGDHDLSSLADTLKYFSSIGIRKFIITFDVDLVVSSEFDILNDYKAFKKSVKSIKPFGVKILITPNVHLSQGVTQNPFLKKLTIPNTDMIFIQTPLFVDGTWLNPDLNYLMYKQKLRPVFTCFERNLISCKYEISNQLYKTKGAIFCIDINYMTSISAESRIRQGLERNINIVPAISNDLLTYYTSLNKFSRLSERLSKSTYSRFCMYLMKNTRSLFNDL